MTNNTKLGRWRFLLAALLAVVQLSAAHCAAGQQATPANQNVYGQPFVNLHTDSSPDGPHLVFAHFQLTARDYGSNTVQGYLRDIREAAGCGIDGFAVDQEGGSQGDTDMVTMLSAADQYDAANQNASNSAGVRNFYILFQPDFGEVYPETPAVLADGLTRYSAHPSYYRYKGRPWFGTYTGEGGGDFEIKLVFGGTLKLLRSQNPPINAYFCPDFNIYGPDGVVGYTPLTGAALSQRFVSNVLSGLADAAWNYGIGATASLGPTTGVPGAETYASQLHAAGLQWMGSVIPQYIGLGHPASDGYRSYTEMYGGEHLRNQWQSIIRNQKAFWVQFITWNDDDEDGGLTNAFSAYPTLWGYLVHGVNSPVQAYHDPSMASELLNYYPSNLGRQAENLFWIQWYKMGSEPKVVNDNLFVSYCPQLGSVPASNDPYGGISPIYTETGIAQARPDFYYITTDNANQDVLTVSVNGTQVYSMQVPAGLQYTRVPSSVGTPMFALSRNGTNLVALTGRPIPATEILYDWYYYTASASSPLTN